MHPGRLNVRAGDSSRCSEEIVKSRIAPFNVNIIIIIVVIIVIITVIRIKD